MGSIRRGLVPALLAVIVTAGCGSSSKSANDSGGTLQVVAAENFWGSIASQLGGSKVTVKSVIASPATDPHDYEPTAADARTIAEARLVIENGAGYDPWAQKLVDANPVSGRIVLDVGDLVGIAPGGNPHRWYSPLNVELVINTIVHDYGKLDPKNAVYFTRLENRLETTGLARYKRLISTIKTKYHGVPVGASESIFAPLADDLGLKLLTPESFLDAVAEGNDPTAADKSTVDKQITGKQIKVFVYNSQNSTPDVNALVEQAKKAGIPITTVTETLVPKGAAFQDWQATELQSLADTLAQATGKAPVSASAAQAPATANGTGSATAPAANAGTGGDGAAAPTAALARTGTSSRWLVLLAGAALVLGGLGVVVGARARQRAQTWGA
jgi:zinc/manganese transport system substrate-binding protein